MITPLDHFQAIRIRARDPLPQPQAHGFVPRYALEPEPPSTQDGSDVAISNTFTNVVLVTNSLQQQIDGFFITCNTDGTFSYGFGPK